MARTMKVHSFFFGMFTITFRFLTEFQLLKSEKMISEFDYIGFYCLGFKVVIFCKERWSPIDYSHILTAHCFEMVRPLSFEWSYFWWPVWQRGELPAGRSTASALVIQFFDHWVDLNPALCGMLVFGTELHFPALPNKFMREKNKIKIN